MPGKKTKPRPDPTDKHVGSRVRVRRLMLDMSQTALGGMTGITFQQIQKYENGINRISSGRLLQFSDILQVPVEFFFEGLPEKKLDGKSDGIAEFVSSTDGLSLMRAFTNLKSQKLKRAIVHLVEQVADSKKPSGH